MKTARHTAGQAGDDTQPQLRLVTPGEAAKSGSAGGPKRGPRDDGSTPPPPPPPAPPSPTDIRGALLRLKRTINCLAALATLTAEEAARHREDEPGVNDEIGSGLEWLTKIQCNEAFEAWIVAFDVIADAGEAAVARGGAR